jgi:hypothetical protein
MLATEIFHPHTVKEEALIFFSALEMLPCNKEKRREALDS